jgi:hypothetical protein
MIFPRDFIIYLSCNPFNLYLHERSVNWLLHFEQIIPGNGVISVKTWRKMRSPLQFLLLTLKNITFTKLYPDHISIAGIFIGLSRPDRYKLMHCWKKLSSNNDQNRSTKMNKLATLFLTATLSVASGAALAADTTSGGSNNGQANASAEAGQVAPDAHQNMAPKGVDNNDVNNSGTMLHPNTSSSASGEGMSSEEVHKNTMCKDGRCPDINKKVDTGTHDVDTKVDGTSQ